MRKLRMIITIDDDTYPVSDLIDMIESEGVTVESTYDLADSDV